MEGHIVRFLFKDFMTYSSVESYPMKHLNIISGGNGTGKSSVFNGILFGLNGKTSFVNRAKSLGDFIKHGKQKSQLEIELFNPRGRNYLIARTIYRNSSSTWELNGKRASQKEVQELVEKLHIQVDNLCQFLPQDRVADFARMNAQELLENTQKAVGDPKLYHDHQRLKVLYTQIADVKRQAYNLNKNIENEEAKNARLRQEVDNFRTKRDYMEKIEMMKKKIAWLSYKKALEASAERKVELGTKSAEVREKANDLRTREKNVELVKSKMCGMKAQKDIMSKEIGEVTGKIADNVKSLKVSREAITKAQTEYELGVNGIQIAENNVKELSQEIVNLEGQLEEEKAKYDMAKDELMELQEKRRGLTTQLNDNRGKMEEFNKELERITIQKTRTVSQIESHRDAFNDKLVALKRQNPDAHNAYTWLQSNRHTFQDQVVGPLNLFMELKPEGLTYLESHISPQDLLGFITYNQHDFVQLTRVRKKMNFKIAIFMERALPTSLRVADGSSPTHTLPYVANDSSNPSTKFINSTYAPRVPMSKYVSHGFTCYLKDFVLTAPVEVISFLCRKYRLQDVPVGGPAVRRNLVEIGKGLKLSTYYAQDLKVSVITSRYRPNEPCFNQRKIRDQANLLRLCGVDPGSVGRADALAKSKELLKETEEKITNILHKIELKKKVLGEIGEAIQRINKDAGELNRFKNTQNIISSKLKSTRSRLEKERSSLKSLDELRGEMVQKIQGFVRKMNAVDTNLALHEEREDLQNRLVTACLHLYQDNSLLSHFLEEFRSQKARFDLLEEERIQKEREFKEASETLKRCLAAAKTICVIVNNNSNGMSLPPHIQTEFQNYPDQVDLLENQMMEIRARADMLVVGDDVVEEFYQREGEIDALRASASGKASEAEKLSGEIAPLKKGWLRETQILVGKINTNFARYFARIDCVGKIELVDNPSTATKGAPGLPKKKTTSQPNCLSADDGPSQAQDTAPAIFIDSDVSQYGIVIGVKFRHEDKMQVLNHKHQSGGERSVSTIFFLLALQELTFCPFRMVDEINQGMDYLNEGKVLELIVELSSKPDVPQYFLLTPKLLKDTCFGSFTKVLVLIRTKLFNGAAKEDQNGEDGLEAGPDGTIRGQASNCFTIPVQAIPQRALPDAGGVIVKTEKRYFENDCRGRIYGDSNGHYPLIDIGNESCGDYGVEIMPRVKISRKV